MLTEWTEFGSFLRELVSELFRTPLDQVRYADSGLAVWLLVVLAAAVLCTVTRRLLISRRHARQHSGHAIDREHQRSRGAVLLYHAPKTLLAAAVSVLAVALAEPFLTATEEVTGDVESRVRIDLVDTSLSMTWELPHTGRARAAAAAEFSRVSMCLIQTGESRYMESTLRPVT